jgi:F1F0 ATPase subunit 2
MNYVLHILLAFVSGFTLGAFFFTGLWLTVKIMVASKTPALLMMVSFFIRTGITLLGFYYVSYNKPGLLVICVTGFILARIVNKRLTRSKNKLRYEA